MTKNVQITYYLSFFLIFSYIIFRGFTLGITHDEALTYKIIQGDEILKNTANHHWLNTYLSAFLARLFGAKEWILRLPNMLSFVLFWYYLYQITKTFLSASFTQISLLLLLCGNPFVLDFFSLCRGYGISLACITASLYYLFKAFETRKKSNCTHHILATLFSILALSANLNTLNYFLVAQALILLNLLLTKPENRIIWFGIIVILCGITLFFSLDRLFFLREKDELYYGSGRLGLTIDNIFYSSIHSLEDIFKKISLLRYLLYTSLLVASIFAIRKKQLFNAGVISLIVLAAIVLALFLEHLLFDTLYPVGRSTLYLYPLILLALLLNVDGIRRKILRIAILTFSWLFLLNNLFDFYTFRDKSITWKDDQHVKMGMLRVKTEIKDCAIHSLSCSWIYEPAINYYRKEYHIPVNEVFRDGINESSEYKLVQSRDTEGMKKAKDDGSCILLFHPGECGLILSQKRPIAAN
ncbi:glycosyltransferase family 39 protein [Fluviicola sp.]|jgi:hypothetical protein|uniref:glycosyltransferase family 39 protein n=1 Tax=Fluviicola sp. TaxID=1917219 RepID=UPI002823E2A1|nr:glycosyltransferase family 39 protein [Fluviicola sp.]MDR0802267.1 glycosyltransferase family 39 protein [Fluviicola sp.]